MSMVLDRDPQHTVAGLSMRGGQKENFFLCLIQYFPQYSRWSLTKLSQVKDYPIGGDDTLKGWVREHDLRHLILDFPIEKPACLNCSLECPGTQDCIDPQIQKMRVRIQTILNDDEALYQQNPKEYERLRLEMEKVYSQKLSRPQKILSKSLKRRLKKGVTPYWHRGVDLWIWLEYYDLFLGFFKTSYDSLGGSSVMLMNRFEYIKRHLPKSVQLWESDPRLLLLEAMRENITKERYLRGLGQLDEARISRRAIIKGLEKKCKVFIYESEQKILEENIKAFDSFLLAVIGIFMQRQWTHKLGDWARSHQSFLAPSLSQIHEN